MCWRVHMPLRCWRCLLQPIVGFLRGFYYAEIKRRESFRAKEESKELLRERKSEATSDETLNDLEEIEKDSNSTDIGLVRAHRLTACSMSR